MAMELTQPDWSLASAGAEEGAGQGKGQKRSGMADERGRTLGGQDAWGVRGRARRRRGHSPLRHGERGIEERGGARRRLTGAVGVRAAGLEEEDGDEASER